jgi:hypothetical protein
VRSVRRVPDALSDGYVLYPDSVAELQTLRPRLRRLVGPALMDLWRGFPDSLLALRGRIRSRAVGRWLAAAAQSRAALAIYDVPKGAGAPARAFLELDFGERPTPGGPMPWVVLVDGLVGRPRACPPALADVYSTLGGIATQHGASGFLAPPAEVRSLVALAREGRLGFGIDEWPESLRGWFAYFDCDGDHLCFRADGKSRWFGIEWSPSTRLVSTRTMVDRLFETLLACEYFHG